MLLTLAPTRAKRNDAGDASDANDAGDACDASDANDAGDACDALDAPDASRLEPKLDFWEVRKAFAESLFRAHPKRGSRW